MQDKCRKRVEAAVKDLAEAKDDLRKADLAVYQERRRGDAECDFKKWLKDYFPSQQFSEDNVTCERLNDNMGYPVFLFSYEDYPASMEHCARTCWAGDDLDLHLNAHVKNGDRFKLRIEKGHTRICHAPRKPRTDPPRSKTGKVVKRRSSRPFGKRRKGKALP